MSLYDLLGILGGVPLLAVIAKGFWSWRRIKPLEQPDNWEGRSGN
jgi:hypothetical protein